jgi:hypothetical protein
MNALYFDTAYIYDALCYFFFFSAFLLYVRVRQQDRLIKFGEISACCVLYICALNSKETAATLPGFLLVYELLYHPPACGAALILAGGRCGKAGVRC